MTILEVQDRVEDLCRRLGVVSSSVVGFYPTGEGTYIDGNGGEYELVDVERGLETRRKRTSDIDELLYWIFKRATFGIAMRFEMNHRIEGQDFRRQLFRYQLELIEH